MVKRLINKIQEKKFKIIYKENETPVYILGKEKSGTTVIANLLATYAGKSLTSDIPPIWGKSELKLFKQEEAYIDFVKNNNKYFSNDIIKEPGLTFIYPQIKSAYPNAKFIMIVRDPRDNIRSIFNRLSIAGSTIDVPLKNIPRDWQHVISNHSFGIEGDIIERSAKRWNLAVSMYVNHCNDFIMVRYEDFIQDKSQTIKFLSDCLGWKELNPIHHLLNKQFQPKGNSEISWINFFGLSNLKKIEILCKERMKDLGYDAIKK